MPALDDAAHVRTTPVREASFADCARLARTMVDREWLENIRSPRPVLVALLTASIWLQLALSWALALFAPLPFSILSFVINCAAVQAMLLWTHEASHYGLTSNRRLNDRWSDIFFSGPIGMSVAAYRAKHMSHHAHLGTEQDDDLLPYTFNIKGRRALTAALLKTLSGQVGIALALDKYSGVAKSDYANQIRGERTAKIVTLIFNGLLLAACVAAGRWYLYFLLWVYPIIAIAILLNVVRTTAEHQPENFPHDPIEPLVRTTRPNWFEKWLLYQANFNFHAEHHLFPGIPHHNLRAMHAKLVERGFYERFPQCLQRSGVAKFVAIARSRGSTDLPHAATEAAPARLR